MSYSANERFLEYWFEYALEKGMDEEVAIRFAEEKVEEYA